MNARRVRLTPELLEDLYVRQGLTRRQIAERCGYSSIAPVQRAMARAGIPARSRRAGPARDASARPRPAPPEQALSKRDLEDLHHGQGLTIAEIAARLGTYSRRVSRRAAELGVPIRKLHASPGARLPPGGDARLARLYGRRDVVRALKRHGVPRRDEPGAELNTRVMHRQLVDDLYTRRGLSATEIGLLLGRSHAAVLRKLRAEGIPVRPPPPRRPPRDRRPRPAPGRPLTREVLLDLYVGRNLTLREVAERTGWRSQGPVRTALRREGIPVRRMTVPKRQVELTPELLEDLYVRQGLSMPTIVRVLGDYSATTIRERLIGEGIPIRGPRYTRRTPMPELTETLLRTLYVEQRLRVHEIAERLGYARAAVSRALRDHGLDVERRRGRPRSQRRPCDRATLEELYLGRDMSAAAVAAELGVSSGFVLRRLHDFGIPVRRNRWERPQDSPARLERLRKDRRVRAALIKAGVPRWREEATPVPEDPLPADLLRTLYVNLGLSMFDIELLSGRTEGTIRAGLVAAGIPVRPRLGYRSRSQAPPAGTAPG
ncbi:MAG: hypothetical protein ACRD1D_05635 [Acidimicrobiales bacterium]